MKLAIAAQTIIIILLASLVVINEKAHLYNEKLMYREFAKRLNEQDSVHKVMYERILKHNYKPKKVK